jgi:acetyl-CoA C-acetyltransferase
VAAEEVVIVSAYNGVLKDVSAVQLGAIVIKNVLSRVRLDKIKVDEVIMGNVLQAGLGQNPARQSSLAAGLPQETPAMTINKVCGSGLKAVQLAWQSIISGESEVVVAGGMENMSQSPYLLQGARSGLRMGDQALVDSLIRDGLWCPFNDYHMGVTAENLCDQYSFTREQLDRFAYDSQKKAAVATMEGRFLEETVAVDSPQRKGNLVRVDRDEYPRPDTSLEGLAKLRPSFKEEGRVTAGNSSGINDGAAALVVMSRRRAEALGLEPMAIIRSNATAGVDPAMALEKAGLKMSDMDLIEVNEAFAAQSLAFASHFDFDSGIMNVSGGAIALGHPIGASGARILVTLLHEMKRREARYALAALCIGGGQGIATIIERP